MRIMILLLTVLALANVTARAEPSFPDRGRAAVVDAAHVLSPTAAHALNERVVAWDRRTGHQLVVVTVPDLQGYPVADYGYQLGRAWGLGDKERNDGAILLLSMKPHEVRIEVGYGLEPVLTDAATATILAEKVVPRLKAGDVPGALSAGADAIMAVPQADVVRPSVAKQDSGFSWWWIFAPIGAAVAAIGAWAAFIVRRGRQRYERMAAATKAHQEKVQHKIDRGTRPDQRLRLADADRHGGASPPAAPPQAAAPVYVPPAYEPPARRSDDSSGSSTPSSWGSFDSGSSSSSPSDSSSSSSGFDSGAGSFGGGGSDSSW